MKSMCGRFSIATPIQELQERFKAQAPDEPFFARYNAAPGQKMLVIPMDDAHQMHFYKWGLIPHWAKDPKIGYKMINARAESVRDKPSFRTAFKKNRCLVLADGFYEWLKEEGKRIPYRITLKDNEPFAFAGLCDTWQDEKGEEIKTFSIITTDSNELVSRIHNRMPVILREENESTWLDPIADDDELSGLLTPYDSAELTAYPISTLVNVPKNDTPEIILPTPLT